MSQPWQLRNVLDNCSLMDNSIQKKLSEDRQSKSFYKKMTEKNYELMVPF